MYPPASEREAILAKVYQAFNERDIDTIFTFFHPSVDWPNGWEGGYLSGLDEVREYWLRQWKAIDPIVVPIDFHHLEKGEVVVRVDQTVRDLEGVVLSDTELNHIYAFEDGLIRSMRIEEHPSH